MICTKYPRRSHKRHDQIISDQIMLFAFQSPSKPHQYQHGNHNSHKCIFQITSKIHAKSNTAHKGSQVLNIRRLFLTAHHLIILLLNLCNRRLVPADIAGKIIQIIQTIIVKSCPVDPAHLRNKRSVFRSDRYLNITLNREHATLPNIVALQHTIHTIFNPVRLRTALDHLLTYVNDLI